MAKKETVLEEFTDDLDGSKAAETVQFSFEGRDYAIDLSKRNAAAFSKAIARYIDAGRKIPARRSGRGSAVRSAAVDLQAVRAWAAENGIAVANRGRIPTTVLEQYDLATS